METKTCKLTIEPLSSFITPLHSDTLFGHLAWVIAYSEGEKVLRKLLEDFKNSPPFILSSGFPEGKLPIPILQPFTRKEKKTLAKERSKSLTEIDDELKEIKKLNYIPINALNGLKEDLSSVALARYLLDNKDVLSKEESDQTREKTIMRTAVSRISGSALETKLFDHSEFFYKRRTKLDIWIRFFHSEYEVEKWFRYLQSYGYGANVSTGSGQFRIDSFSDVDGQLPESSSPNAFMAISNFTPRETDPVTGYYNYIVKRGKLGGLWSVVNPDGRSKANVWKSPLVMFTPGSVFKLDREIQSFYGRMVEKIYPANPSLNIMQYALAFPLGIRLKE